MGISEIVEGIVSNLYWEYFSNKNYNLREREKVIDFVLVNTKLKYLLRDFEPTIDSRKKIFDHELLQESSNYIKKLGIFDEKLELRVKGKDIFFNGNIVTNFFLQMNEF